MPNKRRVLFVTVGTTALSASNLGDLGKDGLALRERCRTFLGGSAAPPPKLFDQVLAAHEELWTATLSIFKHRHYTSAEMASSYFLLRVQEPEQAKALFDPKLDQIVLLSSDTTQGKLCAGVNESLARRHLFVPPAEAAGDAVVVELIEGLDVKKGSFAYKIADSLKKIWDDHPASGETIVNITGGFKGTVPFLTWKCFEAGADARKCRMFYAHESMDRVEHIRFNAKGPNQTQEIVN